MALVKYKAKFRWSKAFGFTGMVSVNGPKMTIQQFHSFFASSSSHACKGLHKRYYVRWSKHIAWCVVKRVGFWGPMPEMRPGLPCPRRGTCKLLWTKVIVFVWFDNFFLLCRYALSYWYLSCRYFAFMEARCKSLGVTAILTAVISCRICVWRWIINAFILIVVRTEPVKETNFKMRCILFCGNLLEYIHLL